jgi:hypothetical protein
MPVSRTEKVTSVDSTSYRARTMTSPFSVNLSALEIRFRRICATLASSVTSSGISSALSNISSTEGLSRSGRSAPRKAPNKA